MPATPDNHIEQRQPSSDAETPVSDKPEGFVSRADFEDLTQKFIHRMDRVIELLERPYKEAEQQRVQKEADSISDAADLGRAFRSVGRRDE